MVRSKTVIAVVIPCYRVRHRVLEVLKRIPSICGAIYIVDDCCPENTGDFVEQSVTDQRVVVLRHSENRGVGAATLTGMARAVADGADIVAKIDGDGQMDPALLPRFVAPLLRGIADYTKGNRFFNVNDLGDMPLARRFGNGILSFVSKVSTGYWQIFDPTNGYIAINRVAFLRLPIGRISERFFFESDMLYHLYLERAVVMDIPMRAIYGDEVSNFTIGGSIATFVRKHFRNSLSRLFHAYFLRDFSMASIYLMFSVPLLAFGFIFGLERWIDLARTGSSATAGTVMLASLPIILGAQMMLAFVSLDIGNVPRQSLQSLMPDDDI